MIQGSIALLETGTWGDNEARLGRNTKNNFLNFFGGEEDGEWT